MTMYTMPGINIKEDKTIVGKLSKYKIIKREGDGLSGVVFKGTCLNMGIDVAIKCFLPLYYLKHHKLSSPESRKEAIDSTIGFQKREIDCLHHVHHSNIVRILDNGLYKPSSGELMKELSFIKEVPFIVTEYVEGEDILQYIKSNNLNKKDITNILTKICDGLLYLHDIKQYLHADIKAENIKVRAFSNEPIILDFALYKNFNFMEVKIDSTTKFMTNWDLFPTLKEDHPLKIYLESSEANRGELRSLCFPWLDLFQFGLLLKTITTTISKKFNDDEHEFIKILIDELTDWDRVIHLNTDWLKGQIIKIDPSYYQYMGLEEMTPPSSAKHTSQLSSKAITISPVISDIINTKSFQRLRSIKQLGFVEIVYPGASHSRLEHCLNAYSHCIELIGSLTHCPRFRFLFSPELAQQAVVMSLLHDINHFPLLHIFQEISKEEFKYTDILDFFCNGISTQDSPSIYEILQGIGISQDKFKDIFQSKYEKIVDKYEPGMHIIKSIIDSGVDVDKLAYLKDDSLYTGVSYGRGIDSNRLIASGTIIKTSEKKQGWHLGFREEGLPAVESLVMARYWMFQTVYWHKLNRAIIAMLLHVIRKIYFDKIDKKVDISDIFVDTMHQSEESILDYLNNKFRGRHGRDSITKNILKERRSIYLELISLQGGSSDKIEKEVYKEFYDSNQMKREKYRKRFIELFKDFVRTIHGIPLNIIDDDLLFDIPGRRIDTAGDIYIELDTGEVKKIEDIGGPITIIIRDFEKLTKRMRVFINPEIVNKLDFKNILFKRSELINLLEKSMKEDTVDQVI